MAWPKGVPNAHASTALKEFNLKPCPQCGKQSHSVSYNTYVGKNRKSYSAKGFRFCTDCNYVFQLESGY